METNKPKLNIGFFFLSLGLLITLITSVVSFLNLVFGTLNKQFPDVLNSHYQYGYSTYDYEGIRMAIAVLVIFFPIFLVVSYFWKKYSRGEMGSFDEIIKKWVIYIILFLSSVVLVVDLVTLVKYFISGEITNRFILKIVSVLVVAVLVGAYHILLLKGQEKCQKRGSIFFTLISLFIVIASLWCSFSIMGSPTKQRLLRLDDRRVNDLQSLQYQIINYWQQKEKLPTKLSDLSNPITGYSLPVDPEFEKGISYEYIPKDKLKFELCATFALPMPKGWRENGAYYGGDGIMPISQKSVSDIYPVPNGGINESWDHEAGRICYERVIDKDIYPPFKNN